MHDSMASLKDHKNISLLELSKFTHKMALLTHTQSVAAFV